MVAAKELETLISEQTIIQQIYLLCIHQKKLFFRNFHKGGV